VVGCDLTGVRVLLVEDNEDCRELFKIILELEGATVATAGGAWEGLKRVGDFAPDVVVTDLGLPDEDGCWLIRSMRAAPKAGARPPRSVIVTANSEWCVRARCLLAGCDAFLSKPVDALHLCAVVAGLASAAASSPPRLCAC
jgi:CheY-like chemotaxis protein